MRVQNEKAAPGKYGPIRSSNFNSNSITKTGVFGSHARKYFERGLPVIPVRGKAPFLSRWSEYCERLPTEAEFAEWALITPCFLHS